MMRIFALTEVGKRLGEKLEALLVDAGETAELSYKPQPFKQQVRDSFKSGERQIFICATGIVMRTLAPVIEDKYKDPAVLVLDELGKFVIPLLSGHEGGANQWAADVAKLIDAQSVITSARAYLEPVYSVGMGCERHCPEHVLQGLLDECLAKANLSIDDISSIHSIDVKADEVGLIELAKTLGKPYQTWDAATLMQMEPLLSMRSEYVFNTVGVYGVAESAALYAAGQITGEAPELVLPKHKNKQATCSIARSFRY
ncbi:cobalamin biosynthesis protein [Aliamphritea ceti]|uniref:cobalamin biosynthesis protein n=1 Tax=Aliamphritea ceti TaxID=1524258 RepID=UPI0021C48FF9|nr:cobalamin biosynthesis protein [Aliamphritea ceti]